MWAFFSLSVIFTAHVEKVKFSPRMTHVSVRMTGLWFLQFEWIIVPLSIVDAFFSCVKIHCTLDHQTHFCIKNNWIFSNLHTHPVWIFLQWLELAKQKAKEDSDLPLQGGERHLKPWLFCSEAFSNPCALLHPLKCQRHLVDSSSQAFKLFSFSQIWTKAEWGYCQSV